MQGFALKRLRTAPCPVFRGGYSGRRRYISRPRRGPRNFVQDDIDDTGDGIGAIDGRRALGQDFDPVDCGERDIAQIEDVIEGGARGSPNALSVFNNGTLGFIELEELCRKQQALARVGWSLAA